MYILYNITPNVANVVKYISNAIEIIEFQKKQIIQKVVTVIMICHKASSKGKD